MDKLTKAFVVLGFVAIMGYAFIPYGKTVPTSGSYKSSPVNIDHEQRDVIMVVPPDTPTCYVKGIIRRVEFEDEYEDLCLKDESIPCPPGVMPGTTRPAQYRLTVLIQEVSFASGSTRVKTCEDLYPAGSEEALYIYKSDIAGEPFEEGQKIEGKVWNSYFRSFTLSRKPATER